MAEMIRRKIKWPTKRRRGGSRVWKSKWVLVPAKPPEPAKKEKATGPKGA